MIGPFCIFITDEVQFALLQLQGGGFVYDIVLYFWSCRNSNFIWFWVEDEGMRTFAGDCHLAIICVLEHHFLFMDFA